DWGLLYTEGHFAFALRVFAKARLPEIARGIWGEEDGVVWECMYFLTDKTALLAPKETVLEELGYAPNFIPQGFSFLGTAATTRRRERHGDADGLIRALTT